MGLKMVRETTDLIGWALEAAAEEDPIDADTDLYWRFGILTQDETNYHPTELQNHEPVYYADSRMPGDSQQPTTSTSGSLAYYPVNGIPLYWILGNSSSAAGVHTLSNIDTGSLPTITIRSERTGGDTARYESARGAKINGISGYINFLANTKVLSEILSYTAISVSAADLAAVHTGYKYPTDDYTLSGTERTGRYKKDTNTVFTWNSASILSEATMFKYDVAGVVEPVYIENQADPEYLDEGEYLPTFSIGVWRGGTNPETMHTDYLAGTQRTLNFKIYNGASYYRDITWTKATLKKEEMILSMGKHAKLYVYHGYAEDVGATVLDGCADDFYED